jgi:WhiB family redox-sensing transcriptional regulator
MVVRHQPSLPEGRSAWPSRQTSVTNWFELLAGPAWHADAACREHPEVRWVGSDNSGPNVRTAKAICSTCLVQAECLAVAMADPTLLGVWGGTTTRERLVRNRSDRRHLSRDDRQSTTRPNTHDDAVVPTSHLTTPRSSNMSETVALPAMLDNNGNTQSDVTKQRNLSNRAVTRYLDWLAGKTPAQRSTSRSVEAELAKVNERLSRSALSSTSGSRCSNGSDREVGIGPPILKQISPPRDTDVSSRSDMRDTRARSPMPIAKGQPMVPFRQRTPPTELRPRLELWMSFDKQAESGHWPPSCSRTPEIYVGLPLWGVILVGRPTTLSSTVSSGRRAE